MVVATSCRRVFSKFGDEPILQMLCASENGIFVFVAFGWQELKFKYCLSLLSSFEKNSNYY